MSRGELTKRRSELVGNETVDCGIRWGRLQGLSLKAANGEHTTANRFQTNRSAEGFSM